MYCSRCGKQIAYNATVCDECKAAESGSYYYYAGAPDVASVQPEAPVESTRMVGFGKALAGTIISFMGYIFSIVAFVLFMFPVLGIVLSLLSAAMGVTALVFGVQSIKTFKSLKNGPGGSPIATLILGIVGTVWAGFTILFAVLAGAMAGFWLAGLITA